jgi:GNAT superfamily N-acetyltransferase
VDDVRVVREPNAPDSLRETVSQRLWLYDAAASGVADYYPINVVLRGAGDELLGAVLGQVWGTWLRVDMVWIVELLRGQGYGRALLQAAEAYGIERGAVHARLDTFSFHAPGFYLKLGYTVFATLEDYPPGHTLYLLRKRLVGGDQPPP